MSLEPPVIKESDQKAYDARPMVAGLKTLINGKVEAWEGAVQEVFAPIYKVRLSARTRRTIRVAFTRTHPSANKPQT